MFGWVFDVLDGVVARLTKQFNKFGAEFDNIADLVNYSIAPSALIYGWFSFLDPTLKGKIIGAILALMPAVFGSIRIARFNIKRIEYPGIWFGLPRPASAFLIVNLFGLSFFTKVPEIGYVLIPFISFMNLAVFPFVGHHKRKIPKSWFIVVGLVAAIIVSSFLISLFTDFKHFFDITFFFFSLYFITYPVLVPKDEKVKIREFLANWKREEQELL
jgi:phosphatidylserine synthase